MDNINKQEPADGYREEAKSVVQIREEKQRSVDSAQEELSCCKDNMCDHRRWIHLHKCMAIVFTLIFAGFVFWSVIDVGPFKIIVSFTAFLFLIRNWNMYQAHCKELSFLKNDEEWYRESLRLNVADLERYNVSAEQVSCK